MATITNRQTELLYPLSLFCSQGCRFVPGVDEIRAAEIPQPFRGLLVHKRDMTSTLEAFHHDRIHVRVVRRRLDDALYSREICLERDRDDAPVEFGAIRFHLERCTDAVKRAILQDFRPFGNILMEARIPHRHAPAHYIRVVPCRTMREHLRADGHAALYGRRNTILNGAGETLAEVIEILPPQDNKEEPVP